MIHQGRDIYIIEEALSHERCDDIVNTMHKNAHRTICLSKETGFYPTDTNYNDTFIDFDNTPELYNFLNKKLASINMQYARVLGLNTPVGTVNEGFKVMTFKKNKGIFDHHVDAYGTEITRRLSVICYLNTVSDGGELVFPHPRKPVTIRPVKGTAVLFPTDWMHSHYVVAPKSEDRYSLMAFIHH